MLLTTLYHRVIFFHYNPNTGQIFAYELDYSNVYKNHGFITISPLNTLIQMQIVDNLLVVHNIDDSSSQLYDLKLEDWFKPLLREGLRVEYGPVLKGKYITDLLQKEETKIQQYQERKSMNVSSILVEEDKTKDSQTNGDVDTSEGLNQILSEPINTEKLI